MNRRKIEALIPRAMELIGKKKELFSGNSNPPKIERKFKGYIDGMGPSIILAGMRQTICFYSEEKENTNRDVILKLLEELLGIENLKDQATNPRMTSIDYRKLRNQLMEGIVALKLALKTFSIEEKGDRNGD